MKHLIVSAIAILAMQSIGTTQAAELTVVAPGGIRAALEQLIPVFEKKTGNTVTATFLSGGVTTDKVVAGEAFDVPIVEPPLDSVVASGHVVAKTLTPLAIARVGVAVQPGTRKPDIATDAAVKRMLLAAPSISFPSAANGAAAGVSFEATMAKLGIADVMRPKIKPAKNGAGAMQMLAAGEVEIGLTFISEMVGQKGIVLVGPLPRDISTPTGFVAFVGAQSKAPKAAAALVKFLASPQAARVYRSTGMSPGR
jgi:molybdate transport system substrate-binding protein